MAMREILIASLVANGILVVLLIDDQKRLKRLKIWSTLLKDVVMTHLDNGGQLDVPEELQINMEAFAIFINNDLT